MAHTPFPSPDYGFARKNLERGGLAAGRALLSIGDRKERVIRSYSAGFLLQNQTCHPAYFLLVHYTYMSLSIIVKVAAEAN